MSRLAKAHERIGRGDRGLHGSWLRRGKASGGGSQNGSRAREELLARAEAMEEQVASLTRQHDSLQRELADAAQVQRRLSIPRQFRRGDVEVAAESFPARHVSGDLLTAVDVGQHTVLALGDICGKGLFAGMWFAHLAGLIRIFAASGCDSAQIAASINSHFAGLPPEPPLATLFLARLDTKTGELTYCNAGHPAPLLLRQDGGVETLDEGGPLLGAFPGAAFHNQHSSLRPGEMVIGYSDGVIECRNRAGEDFDPDRLAAAARNAGGSSATSILFSVLAATQDFAAAQPRSDDIALLVVRRNGHDRAQAMN